MIINASIDTHTLREVLVVTLIHRIGSGSRVLFPSALKLSTRRPRICTLFSSFQVIGMPRWSGLRRSRSMLNESTPEHEPQSGASQEDHSPEAAMNVKRVRWDSSSDLQDEGDSANSDSSGPMKVAS